MFIQKRYALKHAPFFRSAHEAESLKWTVLISL